MNRVHRVVAVVAAALWALPGTGAAQEAEGAAEPARTVLTLGDAIDTALDRNRGIRTARYAVENARERVDESWSELYPSVDFSASYTRNISPQVSFLPARIFDPSAPEGEFISVQFGADNSWQSDITASQILFDPRAFVGVGAAGEFEDLRVEELRGETHETVTRVRTAYFDLLLAQEDLRLTERSVERVRESLEETRAMNEVGLASDYDVLRLEVELANLEPNLRRARNRIASTRRALAVELDMEDAEGLRVAGSLSELDLEDPSANSPANRQLLTLMGADPSTLDADTLLESAFGRRSELRQLEATEELRRAELRVEQVQYLPEVSLFGAYNIQAQQNGALDFFGSGQTRATSKLVGVEVTVPLFTGLNRSALIGQRKATVRQAEIETRLARDRTRTEILDLVDEIEEARLRADAQAQAVRQARRGYEIASAEYREGIAGRLQLTDAEVALRESEFNYAQAVYDYLTARARLDQAVGQVPRVDPIPGAAG